MNKIHRHIVIQDIENFTVFLARLSFPLMMNKWSIDPTKSFDDYLQWVIEHLISSVYNIKASGYFRKQHIWLSIFDENEGEIINYFCQSIKHNDMQAFVGYEVKVLVNGYDLFLVRKIPYFITGQNEFYR